MGRICGFHPGHPGLSPGQGTKISLQDHSLLSLWDQFHFLLQELKLLYSLVFILSQTIWFILDSLLNQVVWDTSSVLGWGRFPGEGKGNSSILAWEIPWAEQPNRLQSKQSQRVRCYWVIKHRTAQIIYYPNTPSRMYICILCIWNSPSFFILFYINSFFNKVFSNISAQNRWHISELLVFLFFAYKI